MRYILRIQSNKQVEFINITGQINQIIAKSRVKEGLCVVFVKHTTAAMIVGEAESDLLEDMERLYNLVPKIGYLHGHGDPGHTPAHILSSALGQSVTLPITAGQLDLGIWQSVVLVELHGPRSREISVVITS